MATNYDDVRHKKGLAGEKVLYDRLFPFFGDNIIWMNKGGEKYKHDLTFFGLQIQLETRSDTYHESSNCLLSREKEFNKTADNGLYISADRFTNYFQIAQIKDILELIKDDESREKNIKKVETKEDREFNEGKDDEDKQYTDMINMDNIKNKTFVGDFDESLEYISNHLKKYNMKNDIDEVLENKRKSQEKIIKDRSGNFTHLHLHTEYSLLDTVGKVKEYIDRCIELGFTSMALTEHGNINSFLKAYVYAKSKNFKIIPGIEAYLVNDMTQKGLSEEDKIENVSKKELQQQRKKRNHIVLLAINEVGYKNLLKISSLGNIEGFYYKPRVDLKLINENKEGLIITSACIFGEISEAILKKDKQLIKDTTLKYKAMFGDNFYLEIQPHDFKEQRFVNKAIIALSRKYEIKLVATNDVHYVNQDDYKAHSAITLLNMKKTISQIDKDRLNDGGFFIKTRKEMYDGFIETIGDSYAKEINQALDNTLDIASKVNVEIDLKKYRMPKFEGTAIEKELKVAMRKRFDEVVKDKSDELKRQYLDRLRYEFNIIKERNLLDFIYIIYDVIKWSEANGIYVGVGRGSVGGSLLCYLLNITKIDPIKYDLLFARFINANRVEMPDIDVDFDSEHRERVKQYLIEKYGKDKVSSVGAFGTFKSRGLLKDLARVFEVPLAEVDEVTKSIPMELDLNEVKSAHLVKRFAEKYPDIWNIALKLEGQVRHFSTHAAGIVISNDVLYNDIPLCAYKNDTVTGWDEGGDDIKCISTMNMMKLDCLGLSTLTLLRNTIDLIEQRHSKKDLKDYLFNRLEPDDPQILNMATKGFTAGIFQFESRSITDLLKNIKITKFENLIAANSLHRPAALKSGFANRYADRKNGKEPITYIHPAMEKILKNSYGLLVYQEDSMKVAKEVAGYTLDEADDLRKITSKGTKLIASGKKYLFDEARERFLKKCEENKVEKSVAEEIFNFIETFANYSFNRAHSAAYAFMAYQCMFLKHTYPIEFMTALLTNSKDDEDMARYTKEAKRLNITIADANINKSKSSFSIHNNKILTGFLKIKGVGEKAVEEIIKNQPYTNFVDFVSRVSGRTVNKRVVKALIDKGCFDLLNSEKELNNYEEIMEKVKKKK